MNRFSIAKPDSFEKAQALLEGSDHYELPVLKAGGMDVIDHMKEGLAAPDLLIDIKRLHAGDLKTPTGIAHNTASGSHPLQLSATTTLAHIAASAVVNELAPVLAQAAVSAATPQVRNVASAAGNLLQRPRCWYYRNLQFDCLKKGGPMCYAVEGENRYHAIFGDGPCHIVHPSNLAPAMMVCGGRIRVIGGKRDTIDIAELFHTPDRGMLDEHNLQPGEVVTHIEMGTAADSAFYAIKEKQSFDWPVVAAAVALEVTRGKIETARVCAAAVAPVPWPLPKVEKALRGVNLDDDTALRKACEKAASGAKPMTHNSYKIQLLPVAVRRAVLKAAGRQVEG